MNPAKTSTVASQLLLEMIKMETEWGRPFLKIAFIYFLYTVHGLGDVSAKSSTAWISCFEGIWLSVRFQVHLESAERQKRLEQDLNIKIQKRSSQLQEEQRRWVSRAVHLSSVGGEKHVILWLNLMVKIQENEAVIEMKNFSFIDKELC